MHEREYRDYTIQAKPTLYNGIVFRSMLEARWAALFSALGISYQYEPLFFKTKPFWYKPDFFLNIAHGVWVEIKPNPPTLLEQKLALSLSKTTGATVIILCTSQVVHPHTQEIRPFSYAYVGGAFPKMNYLLHHNPYHPYHPYWFLPDDTDVTGWSHSSEDLLRAYFISSNIEMKEVQND